MLTETAASTGRPAGTSGSPDAGIIPLGAENSARGRLLVVDDEALIRWAVAETLGPLGYEVVEAASAGEAMTRLRGSAAPFDAILLDLQLPDCADLTLLGQLRRAAPGSPIALMSAFADPAIADEARRLGAVAVLEKPFEMTAVLSLMDILRRDGRADDPRR